MFGLVRLASVVAIALVLSACGKGGDKDNKGPAPQGSGGAPSGPSTSQQPQNAKQKVEAAVNNGNNPDASKAANAGNTNSATNTPASTPSTNTTATNTAGTTSTAGASGGSTAEPVGNAGPAGGSQAAPATPAKAKLVLAPVAKGDAVAEKKEQYKNITVEQGDARLKQSVTKENDNTRKIFTVEELQADKSWKIVERSTELLNAKNEVISSFDEAIDEKTGAMMVSTRMEVSMLADGSKQTLQVEGASAIPADLLALLGGAEVSSDISFTKLIEKKNEQTRTTTVESYTGKLAMKDADGKENPEIVELGLNLSTLDIASLKTDKLNAILGNAKRLLVTVRDEKNRVIEKRSAVDHYINDEVSGDKIHVGVIITSLIQFTYDGDSERQLSGKAFALQTKVTDNSFASVPGLAIDMSKLVPVEEIKNTFNAAGKTLTSQYLSGGKVVEDTKTTVDAQGNIIESTTEELDAKGAVVAKTTTTFNAEGKTLVETQEATSQGKKVKAVMTYSYDQKGNLLSRSQSMMIDGKAGATIRYTHSRDEGGKELRLVIDIVETGDILYVADQKFDSEGRVIERIIDGDLEDSKARADGKADQTISYSY